MNFLKSAVVAAAFTFAPLAAHADIFDFSYTFTDGLALTGSLSGTLSSGFVTGISNIHVSFNGVEFSNEPLNAFGVVSTNGALNNFTFADDTDPSFSNTTNFFSFTNDAVNGSSVFAANTNIDFNNSDFDAPANGSWALVAAPVPEPETYAMMMAGLGLLGAFARRRRQS